MRYEHTTDGKVDERVQAVPDSFNDRDLAEKSKVLGSGWSAVDEFADDKPARGKARVEPAVTA